jgi:hypothetical protein
LVVVECGAEHDWRRPSRLLRVFAFGVATGLLLFLSLFFANEVFAARGHVEPPVTIGQPCPVGEVPCGAGKLKEPAGVAVNETTHDVYVVDKGNDRVEIFSAAGAYLGFFDGSGSSEFAGVPATGPAAGGNGGAEEVPSGTFDEPEGIAIDNDPTSPSHGDVYVVDPRGHKMAPFEVERQVVDKFTASGGYLGQITRNFVPGEEESKNEFGEHGFRKIYGVAVDPRGEVWVEGHNFGPLNDGATNYTSAVQNERITFRSTENTFSSHAAPGFAVDSEDDLYVHNTFGSGDVLGKFSSTGELLNPEFGEFGPTDVAVESSTGNVYVDNGATWTRYTPDEAQLERLSVPGGHGTGIAVDSGPAGAGGGPVYVADSSADVVYAYGLEPPGPPTVEPATTSVTDVTSDTARLEGVVNPRSELGEAATGYRFEYGACASVLTCSSAPYELAVPAPDDGLLAAGYEPEPVAAALAGLEPGTAYHARLAARNSLSPGGAYTHGEEVVFTTQPAAVEGLPDHRSWEIVSPPDKHGAVIDLPAAVNVLQASASGDALTWVANSPTETGAVGFSQVVQVLSRRAGPATAPWQSQDIATPHPSAVGVNLTGNEYTFFDTELSSALVGPGGPFTPLSPEATERTPYLRTNFPPGEVTQPCVSACYTPLVTAVNAPGVEFGVIPGGNVAGAPRTLGASPDGTHVVLSSQVPLTEGALEVPNGSLYEWSAGHLAPISLDEAGNPIAANTQLGTIKSGGSQDIRHTISTDGARLVFSERGGGEHLYSRDMATGETTRLDKVQAGGSGAGIVAPVFQDASADGSRVFFTDTQQLVEGASTSGADLYECRLEAEEAGCALTDLSAPPGVEAADVLGLIPGASADGGSVYFVANGKLTSEPGPHGQAPVAGSCGATAEPEAVAAPRRCNLYRRSGGETSLVAVLSGADSPDWGTAGSSGENTLPSLTDRVSPDGGRLAFMSRLPLTGYDNRDVVTGQPDQEVFLYTAEGAGGRLVCASCDPTGARPNGVRFSGQVETKAYGAPSGTWPETAGIAANIPGWLPISGGVHPALYQSRYLSDQGRLFFNSPVALVPGDSNGTQDVYEYEPPAGAGAPPADTCTVSSPTYSPVSEGCVGLISSGTSREESAFMDASESGNDVFFLTSSRLSGRDEDTAADLYDARVEGGEVEATKAVECTGDACQQPAVPPNDQTPGSLTFQGAGNVVECPKGKKLQKGRCVAKKQKKNKKHGKSKHHKQKSHQKKAKQPAFSKHGGGR